MSHKMTWLLVLSVVACDVYIAAVFRGLATNDQNHQTFVNRVLTSLVLFCAVSEAEPVNKI